MVVDSLKKRTVKGLVWSSIERFSVQAVQFFVTLIIARILSPKEYGLIGMLSIFIGIADSLVNSGFSQALIRKQDRSEVDNCTIFYFNFTVSIILYLILYIAAPFIASFYNEHELCRILRVLGIIVIINGLAIVQRALFTIEINFKEQTRATLMAAIISGVVGVIMAVNGFGVWSLVFQQISNACVSTLLLWFFSKWRPIVIFSLNSFKGMFGYGSKILISGLINTTYNNIYQITIGKIFDAVSLGYYTRAKQFALTPVSGFTEVIQRVMFPVMCKIQQDKTIYKNVFAKTLRVSVFILIPIMCLIAGISKPMTLILLGEKWLFAATLLIPLCFSAMLLPIHALNLNAITVIGRSDLFLKLEIIKKILGIVVLVVTVPFGVVAMCYGSLVSSVIGLLINAHYSKQEFDYGLIEQMKDVAKIFLLSISIFIVTYVISNTIENSYFALLTALCSAVLLFVMAIFVFKFKEIEYIKSLRNE